MNTHQHNHEQPDKAQQKAKIESLKKSWQLRKDINEKLSKIKNKIAVYSGKGGVGKTTVAVNIAAFFAQQGNSVGILDADIDCPNVVNVFGVNEKPLYKNNQIRIKADNTPQNTGSTYNEFTSAMSYRFEFFIKHNQFDSSQWANARYNETTED